MHVYERQLSNDQTILILVFDLFIMEYIIAFVIFWGAMFKPIKLAGFSASVGLKSSPLMAG